MVTTAKQKDWIRIPDLGKVQAVCNTVRALLKREKPNSQPSPGADDSRG
jgi:hypothetical protein